MKNKAAFIPLGFFVLLVVIVAIPLLKGTDPSVVPSALVGKPVPSFDLPPALAGVPGVSAKDVVKGPVLVNFFASWCLTCGAEHKLLDHIAKNEGVTIYGIDYKDKKPDIAAWIGKHGNPYKAVGFDADGRVGIDWGVYGVPETYIISPDGVIALRFVGPMTDDDYINTVKPRLEALRK